MKNLPHGRFFIFKIVKKKSSAKLEVGFFIFLQI